MAPPRGSDRGTYLPSGARIVGRGAEDIAERAAAELERLQPGAIADTLYAVNCTLASTVRARPTVEHLLDAITEDIRRTWPECPRLVRDEAVARAASRFGGVRWDALVQPGKGWAGEVVWRAVHPVVAGAPITTHVILEERPTFVRLGARVTADHGLTSVRGFVGAGQAQPAFVQALRAHLTPTWLGAPLASQPVRQGEVADLVRSLASATRDHPLVVLAPREDNSFVIDPDDLVWDLFGRARLCYLVDHRLTFELSDTVGDRRMSCYWGAVRCYLPDWSPHDDPHEHPLLTADRLEDPVMRATWLGEVGVWMGSRVTLPPTLEERRAPPPAPEPVPARPTPAVREPETPAAVETARKVEADASPVFDSLIVEVRKVAELVNGLRDEVERLRTISAVRASSTSAIERRLGRLEDILQEAFPAEREALAAATPSAAPDEEVEEGRTTLVDVVQAAAEAHEDALLFLDTAYSSAGDSPYEDPERVRAILDAMARVAARRRDGVLGTSLRDAFSDLGVDYRPGIAKTTSARLREQYRFPFRGNMTVEAEEHIALGGTYDPRRCLRIYFSSRVTNEPRFVIAHVGRHFEVLTTT